MRIESSIVQSPGTHGYTNDDWNVQLLGDSCADNGNAQLLDANPVLVA